MDDRIQTAAAEFGESLADFTHQVQDLTAQTLVAFGKFWALTETALRAGLEELEK